MAAAIGLHLDADENRAEVLVTLAIDEVFDEHSELRLWEDADGWEGYAIELDEEGQAAYYYVNTWKDEGDWSGRMRVGERAVRLAIQSHVEDPAAGGVGVFERRCRP